MFSGKVSVLQNSMFFAVLTCLPCFSFIVLPWSDPCSDEGLGAPFSNLPGSNCACQMEHLRNTHAGAFSQGSIARRSCRCMKGPFGGLWAAFRRQRLRDFVIRVRGYFAADEHIRCNFNGAGTLKIKCAFWKKIIFIMDSLCAPSPS